MDERLMPEDVGCSICLEILYEPITMPCKHKMCKVRKVIILSSFSKIVTNKISLLEIK